MENESEGANTGTGGTESLKASLSPVMQVILYDKTTGRIVETHRAESLAAGAPAKPEPERFLREAAEDPFTLRRISGGKKENLAAMEVPAGGMHPLRMMVDIGSGKLVPKPRLQLSAPKTQLEGDGKDAVEIEVSLVGPEGERIPGFDSEIVVRTSRGKLSARGGRLRLKGGSARITLTSVAETVNEVRVSARSPGAPAEGADLILSFV
jgi:hypothetical protein